MIPPVQVALESLLAQLVESQVFFFNVDFAYFSIGNSEILVETVSLYIKRGWGISKDHTCYKVSGDGVGFVQIGLISVFDKAANSGLQTSNLNLITVFLGSLLLL